MRPDRVVPPGADPLAGGLPLYGNGFSNPLTGNPRGEPTTTVPSVDTRNLNTTTPGIGSPGAGNTVGAGTATSAALASSSSASPTLDMLKDNWPWLVVGALVVAALVVK